MDPATRVKLALDESRMLILGAQVLLGFQLRSAFQDRFEQLSPHAKTIDAASLVLMIVVIWLLIALPIHHRVVENGNATARILRAIGIIMPWALLPLALSLGFNGSSQWKVLPARQELSGRRSPRLRWPYGFALGLRGSLSGNNVENPCNRLMRKFRFPRKLTRC